MDKGDRHALSAENPLIVLVIGINGGGKTTTIGKLAYKLKQAGRTVMLAAADTFRAAAAKQLVIWGERNNINVVHHQEGADPSAAVSYTHLDVYKRQEEEIETLFWQTLWKQ